MAALVRLFVGKVSRMNDFFFNLFRSKPADDYILLWEKIDDQTNPEESIKRSSWFQNVEDAIKYAQANCNHNIYVGCGTSPKNFGSKRRCQAHQIAGIPGLWLDIDIAHGTAHKKENLPRSIQEARKIIEPIPLTPSMVVHSGHGLQFWWLFEEFISFKSDEHRTEIAELTHGFLQFIKDTAWAKHKFEVDMVFDLSRVLRIPDTANTKTNPPVFAKLMACCENRYTIEDMNFFEPVQVAKKSTGSKNTQRWQTITYPENAQFTLDPEANPPFEKFEALKSNEPRFGESWEMKRKDFSDSSPSSYDYSLASFAFYADWTWQEVANLIISFRRKHDIDLKLRYDYYERTLARAYDTVSQVRAQENIEDMCLNVGKAKDLKDDERREVIGENISKILGIKIKRIIKFIMDPPHYKIETPVGNVMIGTVGNLINQDSLRNHLAAATGKYLNRRKNDKWAPIAQALLDACEEVEVGEEGSEEGIMRAWLNDYMQDRGTPSMDPDDAQIAMIPFQKDGYIYFFGTDFRSWLSMFRRETMTPRQMGYKLRNFGCVADKIGFKYNEKFITKSVWRLPPTFTETFTGHPAPQVARETKHTGAEVMNISEAKQKKSGTG